MNKYFCTNRDVNYKDDIEKILQDRKNEILSFFEVDDNGQFNFNIYVYDNISDLVSGLKSRGYKDDMPDYMCACYKDEDNSLNFFEPLDDACDNEWTKDEYKMVIFHEEIHGVQSVIYGRQAEWLTEGVAKYLDGTYNKGVKYLLDTHINKNNIPSMYELENEFGKHDYDSYDYAYLMVSYLIETLGKHNFLEIIKSRDNVKKISEDLVYKAIDYYNNKYNKNIKNRK